MTNASAKQDRLRWKVLVGGFALIVAMTFIAYAPALSAGYIWDDDYYLTKNPLITAPDGLQRIWFSTDSPSQYFPLVYTSFRIEHAIWGMNPRGYHAVNIALHAINALLVWLVLRKLNVPGAYFAACVFALHPVHVESVAWITERKNVLSGVFYWLSLLAWMGFAGLPSGPGGTGEASALRKKTFWYVAAFMSFVLAMFAKTTACTLPAAMVLVLWVRREKLDWRRWLQIAPFVLWGLFMGLVTVWWEQSQQGTGAAVTVENYPWIDRLLVASRATWFYLGKLLWPVNLSFSYARWSIDAHDPSQYLWLIATLIGLAALWYFRRHRGFVAAILYFLAAHLPTIGFIPLVTFLYSWVADHYQYLPSVGPIALLAGGLAWWLGGNARRRGMRVAIEIAMITCLGILTWRQSRVYADSETLWRDTIDKNPASWMAHNNLGTALLKSGHLDEAEQQFHRVIELKSDHADARLNLGLIALRRQQPEAAAYFFTEALRVKPDYEEPLVLLGRLRASQGRATEAIDCFRRAIALDPDHPRQAEVEDQLGIVLAGQGRFAEAIEHFSRALALRPRYEPARQHLSAAQAALRSAPPSSAPAGPRSVDQGNHSADDNSAPAATMPPK